MTQVSPKGLWVGRGIITAEKSGEGREGGLLRSAERRAGTALGARMLFTLRRTRITPIPTGAAFSSTTSTSASPQEAPLYLFSAALAAGDAWSSSALDAYLRSAGTITPTLARYTHAVFRWRGGVSYGVSFEVGLLKLPSSF